MFSVWLTMTGTDSVDGIWVLTELLGILGSKPQAKGRDAELSWELDPAACLGIGATVHWDATPLLPLVPLELVFLCACCFVLPAHFKS